MKGLKTRHWALHSHGALAGKSTFIAANCRAPIIVVDTDGRFEAVEGLVQGQVLYPEQVIDPLTLVEDIIELHGKHNPASMAWDSLTKLYSVHARIGYMRGRSGRKTAKGKDINRAAELIEKSNAMTIARDLAILGTDMYYVWHTTSGVGGTGDSEIRDMISSIEKERLMTSVNVVLEFMAKDDRYGVMVVSARDYGGRKSNTGFTMWDKPGNYWHGAAERLERLIYTSFVSKDEMMSWGAERLGIMPDEAEGEYENLKSSAGKGATRSQLSVAWIEHVDGLVGKRTKPPEKEVVPEVVAQEPEDEQPDGIDDFPFDPSVPDDDVKELAEELGGVVKKDQAEEPEESVADDPPKSYNFDGELIQAAKKALQETNENGKTYLKYVVAAVRKAVPWKYADDDAVLKRVPDYPKMPASYNAIPDQITTMSGAEKLFDWLVFEA